MEPTFWAALCTASASVMSIMRGTKPLPNSFCKRSPSACLRTEPNTRKPFEIRTFVVPQPIPVDTPVTTTPLLFAAIELLLRWTPSTFIIYTVHLRCYICQGPPRPRRGLASGAHGSRRAAPALGCGADTQVVACPAHVYVWRLCLGAKR